MPDEDEIVPGGVYRKKAKESVDVPVERFGVMTNLFRRGESLKGLLQDDGGRVPYQKSRGTVGNLHELELVARPVPVQLYTILLKLVPIIGDLLEIVQDHRARKAKSK